MTSVAPFNVGGLAPRTLQEIDPRTGEARGVPVGIETFSDAKVLVVLGDPGAGKTTLLESLAEAGGALITARRASIRDGSVPSTRPLIDGLDEVAGDITEAMETISARLSAADSPPVVLSCRVQDWRTGTALHQLEETYGKDVVRVAVLQPLDEAGVLIILNGKTPDPRTFVRTAKSKGLQGFMENPNDLLLLVDATRSGWPTTRTELLENATSVVLAEDNDFHAGRREAEPDDVKAASGWISATLLIAGVDDVQADGSGLADPAVIGLSRATVAQAMKSRLFAGPTTGLVHVRHKTIAEFLAGRWLAGVVDSAKTEQRIRALLLAPDGSPPASLRAVYAWLVHFLDPGRVETWLAADPVSLVLHGDASAFADTLKVKLLDALAAHVVKDPSLGGYVDQGDRWAGLYSPGTTPHIISLLTDSAAPTILKNHLLDGAAAQPASADLFPTLLGLSVDPTVERDVRRRAIGAYLAAGADETPIWDIVREMNADETLDPDFILRAAVLRNSPSLSVPDLAGVLGALFRATRAIALGRISYTFEHLPTADLPALLDVLLELQRPKWQPTRANRNLNRDIDNVWLRVVRRLLEGSPDTLTDDRLVGLHRARVMELSFGRPLKSRLIALAQRPSAVSKLYDDIAAGPVAGLGRRFSRAFPLGEALLLYPDEALIRRLVGELKATSDAELGSELCQCIWAAGLALEPLGVLPELESIINARPELAAWRRPAGPGSREFRDARRQAQEDAQKAEMDAVLGGWQEKLTRDRAGVAGWTDDETLEWLGDLYAGHPSLSVGEYSERRRAANLKAGLGADLAGEVVMDLMKGLRHATPSPRTRSALLAAMDLTHTQFPDRIEQPDSIPDPLAGGLLLAWLEEGVERYDPFTGKSLGAAGWPMRLVQTRNALVRQVLVRSIVEGLRRDHDHVPGLYQLVHAEEFRSVRTEWAVDILSQVSSVPPAQAEDLFVAALSVPRDPRLSDLAVAALARTDLRSDARARWSAVAWLFDPEGESAAVRSIFASGVSDDVWAVLATLKGSARKSDWSNLTEAHLAILIEALARRFPYRSPPASGAWGGHTNDWDGTDIVKSQIHALGKRGTESARDALRALTATPSAYDFELRQALVEASTAARDIAFADRDTREVSAALMGGPPATLREAVATMEAELRDLERYYRTGDLSGWRKFWNLDDDSRTSKAVRIKGENECRNYLVDDLKPRLAGFAMRPEAATANADRLDIAVDGPHGMFPVEVKLDDNGELWTAADSQLSARYADDYRAGGFGIYLVIWTGRGRGKPLPPVPDGAAKPTGPEALETMQKDRLSPLDRERVTVVVLDLSKMD